ncbi:MAG: STAS domain-containing protein [Chitinispirillaceae bacterium]
MRSDALDITIESRRNAVWLLLSGPFHAEQVPNIREKITGLIHDGNRRIILHMESISYMHDSAIPMFLDLLNITKGKNGELVLIFRNDLLWQKFKAFRHLFSIYPDTHAYQTRGLFRSIKRRGMILSRKTGIRLSRPVALFMLIIIVGWFLSLAFIINMQNSLIRQQEKEINDLAKWKMEAQLELEQMQERLLPLQQLGLIRDSLPK